MTTDDPIPPPKDDDGWSRYVVFTVLTAGLTAGVTALATWAVDELRERYGTTKRPVPPEKP